MKTHAVKYDDRPVQVTVQHRDPFVAAAWRVRSLISTVGDGEEELMNSMVSEEHSIKKLGLAFLVGSITIMASLLITKLADADPFGGMALDTNTGSSALIGCLAAAPVALLKALMWQPTTHKKYPVIQDYHLARAEEVEPWLQNMSRVEMLLLCALESVPVIFLLLPAANAIIGQTADIISHLNDPVVTDNAMRSLESLGVKGDSSEAPNPQPRSPEDLFNIQLWGLLLTSSLAGLGKVGENVVDGEVEMVLDQACDNADSFYRVTSTSQTGQEREAKIQSTAFKSVCEAYIDVKNDAANVSGLFISLEIAYVSALWFVSNNLASSLFAFFLISAVDYHHYFELISNKQKGKGAGNSKANEAVKEK